MNSSRGHHGEGNRDETFSILPASIAEMLKAQTVRYRQDFETAVSLVPSARGAYQQSNRRARDSYRYAWCVINTRSLYFNPPSMSAQSTQLHTDMFLEDEEFASSRRQSGGSNRFMVLCPLIDLLNHTSESASACKVTHDNSGFTVISQKALTGGEDEELFVSYGTHSNDFLLVEYGFLLPDNENTNDSISLDSFVLPALSVEQKRRLDAKGYLGEYTLFSPAANGGKVGVCWRTEVAARIGLLPAEQWDGFVDGLVDEDELGTVVKGKAGATVQAWVTEMKKQADRSVAALRDMGNDQQEIVRLFGDVFEDNGHAKAPATSTKSGNLGLNIIESGIQLARRRYDVVFERWGQILHICASFLDQNEK